MLAAAELERIPLVEAAPTRIAGAARLLEQAVRSGCADPEVSYLLALAYKRQGMTAEARQALGRITKPDASVCLQLGMLALEKLQLAQAGQEFARALEFDPACYEAAYNLIMTRLTLAQLDACLAQLPATLELAPSEDERRFLRLLHVVLHHCPKQPDAHKASSEAATGPVDADVEQAPLRLLHELILDEEERLLELFSRVVDLDVSLALLKTLRAARPDSPAVKTAFVEAALVQGKALFDRCEWPRAEQFLAPVARDRALLAAAPRNTQAAFLNLLGCCACLNQDPEGGRQYFTAGLKLTPHDWQLHQNLALAWEWTGNLVKADPHWNRCLDLLESDGSETAQGSSYREKLAFEMLTRLAGRYSEASNWSGSLPYMERALRLRPGDTDVLERLFQHYQHLKRPKEARRTLARLRELRPGEPQWELYELDLVEISTLGDIDRVLNEIERICERYPQDARVEERAVALVGNVFPWINNRCEQLSEQLHRIRDQLRNLPSYQVNWSAVHDVTRDLVREFHRLRKIAAKCLSLVQSEEHRRVVQELSDLIDRRIEDCRRLDD